MREIDHALNEAPRARLDDAVQQQRQADRGGEVQHQLQQSEDQRVAHSRPEVRVGKQSDEVLEPNPGAGEEPEKWQIALESYDVAEEWQVVEDQKVRQARNNK